MHTQEVPWIGSSITKDLVLLKEMDINHAMHLMGAFYAVTREINVSYGCKSTIYELPHAADNQGAFLILRINFNPSTQNLFHQL